MNEIKGLGIVDFNDKDHLRIMREGVSIENQKIMSFDKVPNEAS